MNNDKFKVVSWTWSCPCGQVHRTIMIGDAGSHQEDALAFVRHGSEAGICMSEPCIRDISVEELEAFLAPELCM